jgi:hypothetical protein
MRIKNILFFIIALVLTFVVQYFFGMESGGAVFAMAGIVGGPFRDFKYAGIALTPASDSEAEYQTNSDEYEVEASPNGDFYSTYSKKVGYVQQECVFTPVDFEAMKVFQDGVAHSGTATAPDGSVISVNGIIDGEFLLSNGRATLKISGKVGLQ